MRKREDRNRAIQLRKKGESYSAISKIIRVPKSTLSNWLSEIVFSPNKKTLDRIKEAPKKSARVVHRKKLNNIETAKELARQEVGKLTDRDLFMLGIGLYLGEGAKSIETVRIINSDPKIINVSIHWLKDICKIKPNQLKLTLHIYPDIDMKKAITYWSKITGIPKSQFCKTQIDLRQNKSAKNVGKLPYGTVQLRVLANGESEFGVFLHRRIMGWIESTTRQINLRD